mgnify:CR=1 FL=1|jgi:hypothetical protein
MKFYIKTQASGKFSFPNLFSSVYLSFSALFVSVGNAGSYDEAMRGGRDAGADPERPSVLLPITLRFFALAQ